MAEFLITVHYSTGTWKKLDKNTNETSTRIDSLIQREILSQGLVCARNLYGTTCRLCHDHLTPPGTMTHSYTRPSHSPLFTSHLSLGLLFLYPSTVTIRLCISPATRISLYIYKNPLFISNLRVRMSVSFLSFYSLFSLINDLWSETSIWYL